MASNARNMIRFLAFTSSFAVSHTMLSIVGFKYSKEIFIYLPLQKK